MHRCSVAYKTPLYVWPLYYRDPHFEIKTSTSNGESGCSVSEGSTYPGLNYSGISLSGNIKSYVDLEVSSAEALQDFVMSLTVYPLVNSGGTIFHYRNDPLGKNPVSSGITDIILSFNSTMVFLDAFGARNISIGSVAINYTLRENTWNSLSITYDKGKSEIKVSNFSKELGKVSLPTSLSSLELELPGVIRVGGSVGNHSFQGFNGYAVCLVLHQDKFGNDEPMRIIEECSTSKWNISQIQRTGKCDVTLSSKK